MFTLPVDGEVDLELAEESHAQAIFDVVDRNRDHLRPWMPWLDTTVTVADTLAFLKFTRGEYAAGRSFHCNVRENGAIVGGMGLHIQRAQDSAELGYWLDAAAVGRGIATRAARALTAAAFEQMGLHRLLIRAGVENARSRAVAERLGYTFEGVLRECEKVGETYLSHAAYSMLSSEWPAAGTLAGNDAGA
jgi:ribosomal-protein-serine acetyltransferase